LKKEKIPYKEIDPGVREIIRKMNKLDFIETMFSCAGHPVKEIKSKKEEMYHFAELYIMFKSNDELRLFDFMYDLTKDFYVKNESSIRISKHYDLDGSLGLGSLPRTYWLLNVTVTQNKKEDVERILKIVQMNILASVERMVKKYCLKQVKK